MVSRYMPCERFLAETAEDICDHCGWTATEHPEWLRRRVVELEAEVAWLRKRHVGWLTYATGRVACETCGSADGPCLCELRNQREVLSRDDHLDSR